MSLFSSIGKFFKKIFDAILKFLKKFWWVIVIILIILAVFFPAVLPAIMTFLKTAWATVGGWISTAWGAISSWGGKAWTAAQGWVAEASFSDVLKLAAGAAVLIDPEGVVGGVGSAISKVVKSIPKAVWLVGGGVLAFWLLKGSKNAKQEIVLKGGYNGSPERS